MLLSKRPTATNRRLHAISKFNVCVVVPYCTACPVIPMSLNYNMPENYGIKVILWNI
jgi:hypothetical protein